MLGLLVGGGNLRRFALVPSSWVSLSPRICVPTFHNLDVFSQEASRISQGAHCGPVMFPAFTVSRGF